MKLRGALALALMLGCAPALAQVTPGTSPLSVVKGGTGGATAAAARSSLGLAIGSNVEAWDTDLDCLAALATTGVIQRTGSGTCAALTNSQLTALINPATATLPGALPAWPNNTTTFLRGDGTYQIVNPAAGGTGLDNSAAATNDILSYNGSGFLHTTFTAFINTICTVSPSSCNLLFGYNNVLWYGAKCDGATDDTAAINSAITALSTLGGAINFPTNGSICLAAGTLTIGTHPHVRLVGSVNAGTDTSGNIVGTSQLRYSGTGLRFIDARDSRGFEIRGMIVTYSNAGFTGTLVDLGTAASGVSAYSRIRESSFGTSTSRTGTATLIGLYASVDSLIESNYFYHGAPAITGETVLGQNTVTTIRKNTFAFNEGAQAVSGCGESWLVEQNSFEPTTANNAGGFANTSLLPCLGISFHNNWFGDATASGGTWINGFFKGASFVGNRFGGFGTGDTAIALNTSNGVAISGGNYFSTFATGINCTTAVGGLLVSGNTFTGVVTQVANPANCTPNFISQANN